MPSDRLKCKRCVHGVESRPPPAEADTNSDLSNWFHSEPKDKRRIPDNVLKAALDGGDVSFVFHQKSHEHALVVAGGGGDDEEDC